MTTEDLERRLAEFVRSTSERPRHRAGLDRLIAAYVSAMAVAYGPLPDYDLARVAQQAGIRLLPPLPGEAAAP